MRAVQALRKSMPISNRIVKSQLTYQGHVCMRQCMHISYYCMRQYDTLVCMYITIRTYLLSLLVCLCTKKYSGLLSCENFFRSIDIPLVLSYVFSLPNYRLTNFLLYLFVFLSENIFLTKVQRYSRYQESKLWNCVERIF